ncbi:MAG: hypothetical protein IT435_18805 [Phycisphaerales bacterium]|nr:hypothetical protein [Phycisphaerales bacterium]
MRAISCEQRCIGVVRLWIAALCAVGMVGAWGCAGGSSSRAEAADELSKYNVVWSSPSKDAAGSMPIGNGVMGANVWFEENGDLVLLLSRVDSWSENERLLKLGRVRISSPVPRGSEFRQELVLADGRLDIRMTGRDIAGNLTPIGISVWVDSRQPVVHVVYESGTDIELGVQEDNWRHDRNRLTDADEMRSAWAMHSAPADIEVWEGADVAVDAELAGDALGWYHRNEHSIVPMTVERQGLTDERVRDEFADPLINRTFGCWVSGEGLKRNAANRLMGKGRRIHVAIASECSQTTSSNEWIDRVRATARSGSDADASRAGTAGWWNEFWGRSWIFVEGDPSASAMPRNTHPLRIGCDSNGANVFRGSMWRPMLFEDVRTAAQIAEMHVNRPSHPAPGQVAAVSGAIERFERIGAIGDGGGAFEQFRGGHLEARGAGVDELASFTAVAWIDPDKELGPARIFDKMTAGGSDGFIFDTHPGTSLRLICGKQVLEVKDVLKHGEWQQVAASYDGKTGTMKIYHNGKVVGQTAAAASSDPVPPSMVTRAYVLQRWMLACASRGDYPPKFNGSIFTVEPKHVNGKQWNPDWRAWGGSYWWQNTRLPYYPMLAAGDYDLMKPLFDFYWRGLEACKARTHLYYGCSGVYFPETMTMFYTYSNGDYGWKREGLAAGDISPCPWWQWAWNQSLELSQLMLDYYDHTGDEKFLVERALPMVRESLEYFSSRFYSPGICVMGQDGVGNSIDLSEEYERRTGYSKMKISPTQAVETYWKDVVNDAPTVAGIRAVARQALRLPDRLLNPGDRHAFMRVLEMCPELPVEVIDGERIASPAESYNRTRSNCETPELYPVFPFRLYGIGSGDDELALARRAYGRRHDKATVGWTQDGSFAAMLGLVDDAESQMIARAGNSHKNFRFPAMWGPNFDWLPDQCHGGNVNLLLQLMLMQEVNGKICVLPAWPDDWNATFRLHATGQTVVEGRVHGGMLVDLDVQPRERMKDVRVMDASRLAPELRSRLGEVEVLEKVQQPQFKRALPE